MTALKVQEFVIDSVAAATSSLTEGSNLRLFDFGHLPGFRFELSFLNEDGLEIECMALATIYENRLLLILYTGTRLYCFPRYQEGVERAFFRSK
jgi:hypothetical protein